MPNITTSTDIDNFMKAANSAAARTAIGAGTPPTTESVLALLEGSPVYYLAPGDGFADDRARFQSLVNTVGAAGGGVIQLGGGDYLLSENGSTGYCVIVPYHNVQIQGVGVATRIACTDATATTLLFATEVGPYNSSTLPVEHCGIRDVWFNPTIQKGNDAIEVHVPYTRHFTLENIHYGRNRGLVSYSAADIESGIGTFLKGGDELAPPSSTLKATNIRGFGYYRAFWFEQALDFAVLNWFSDANRADANSCVLSGGSEANLFTSSDWVNTAGLGFASNGKCFVIDDSLSGVPRFNGWDMCFFDTHYEALEIVVGEGNTFSNCWLSGGFGLLSRAGSKGNRFVNCRSSATLYQAYDDVGNNNTFTDCEAIGAFSSSSESNRMAFRVGATARDTVITNFSTKAALYGARFAASNANKDIYIDPSASGVKVVGGVLTNGIADLSDAASLITRTNLAMWFRAGKTPPVNDGLVVPYWPNTVNALDRTGWRTASGYTGLTYHAEACGGKPALAWRAHGTNNDRYSMTNSAGAVAGISLTDFSVVMLVKISIEGVLMGAAKNHQLRFESDNRLSLYSSAPPIFSTVAVANREWAVYEFRRSGTEVEFYVNGAKLGATVAGAPTTTFVVDALGGVLVATLQPRGFIAEAMIFTAPLDSTVRAQVMNYMNLIYPQLMLGW